MANAIGSRVERPIQFFHMPVPKSRTDDGYFAPLEHLRRARTLHFISVSSITTTRKAMRHG
jgi:hypothetical protein